MRADGGFVASTLGLSNEDFNAGRLRFKGNGHSAGVSNQGWVTTKAGGHAALIGGTVSNEGTITVPVGKVGLGSGEQATLDLNGDGFLQVGVPTTARAADGKALVEQSGSIRAKGGTVEIKAANVRETIRSTVNVSGEVQARSVSGRNGAILLSGGEGGNVRVSGKLDVSGRKGGRIDVRGGDVRLEGATIKASGKEQGGVVRIGGAFRGGKAVKAGDPASKDFVGRFGAAPAIISADRTRIDAATTIDISGGKSNGTAGTLVVWSKQTTTMRGSVDATGGKLLLDPDNIVVNGVGGSTAGSYLIGDAPGGTVTLKASDISDLLVMSGVDVTLQAANNITFSGNVGFGYTAGQLNARFGTLTLQAGNSINLAGSFALKQQTPSGTTDGSVVLLANDATMAAAGARTAGTARISTSGAAFDLGRGRLTMAMGATNGANVGGQISVGLVAAADSVTVTQSAGAGIWLSKNVTTAGAQTYDGPLEVSGRVTLQSGSFNWT